MTDRRPIGVIDSGVGGLTVLKRLMEEMPHERFLYLGDTARTPYGVRSREEIVRFVGEMTGWLERQGIKELVVACNTITVLGEKTIKGAHEFPVIGMSKGEKLVLETTRNKKIGVFATDFTVSTGAHEKAIHGVDPEAEIYPVGCTRFVPLIETEQFGSPDLKDAVLEYADRLKAKHVDTVLLACTHYPFVEDALENVFGPEVKVVDPAEATARTAREVLEARGELRTDGEGYCEICFTGDPELGGRLAARMVDMERCEVRKVDIHK